MPINPPVLRGLRNEDVYLSPVGSKATGQIQTGPPEINVFAGKVEGTRLVVGSWKERLLRGYGGRVNHNIMFILSLAHTMRSGSK